MMQIPHEQEVLLQEFATTEGGNLPTTVAQLPSHGPPGANAAQLSSPHEPPGTIAQLPSHGPPGVNARRRRTAKKYSRD